MDTLESHEGNLHVGFSWKSLQRLSLTSKEHMLVQVRAYYELARLLSMLS